MFTRFLLRSLGCAACGAILTLLPRPALATIFTVSGTLSGTHPVSASATFVSSGSTLTLTLFNTSPTPTTIYPDQVLSSFYFDMLVDGTGRVGLALTSGSGNVFKIIGGGTAAQPYLYVPPVSGTAFTPGTGPSNLVASGIGYDTWYYKDTLNVSLPPNTAYGIGTVGNSTVFGTNGFPAQYVDQIDFGIFSGNASDPRGNLNNVNYPYFVSGSATFTFAADRDISSYEFTDPYVFGFGTGPDQYISIVPEPAGLALVGGGAVAWWGLARRRRSRAGRPLAAADGGTESG